jgi:hypothetical protein
LLYIFLNNPYTLTWKVNGEVGWDAKASLIIDRCGTGHDKSTTFVRGGVFDSFDSFRGGSVALLSFVFLFFLLCSVLPVELLAMNAGDPRGYDEQHYAAGASPPRPVSPLSHSPLNIATNGAAMASERPRFRPLSPTASEGETGPAPKKAKKSYDAIKKEVQDLLEKNLMGTNDDAVKVETMDALKNALHELDWGEEPC